MRLNYLALKVVRWTGLPMGLLTLAFLFTGYAVSGRYGLGRWVDEKTALSLHKMLHVPLLLVVVAHSVPALYLATQRWKRYQRDRRATAGRRAA